MRAGSPQFFAVVVAAFAALATLDFPAAAQVDLGRFERQLETIRRQTSSVIDSPVPADRRTLFDYGGYLAVNYFSLDDLNRNNHGLREYDLVGYARANLDDVHEFFARGRLSYLDYNPGDSFDREGDDLVAEVERAYYRFDLRRALAAYSGVSTTNDLVIEGGRQFVYWANGLVLGRTLDGLTLGATAGDVDLSIVAGVTPQRTVDFDTSRPNFDDHTLRGFYGGMLTATVGEQRPYAYALLQRDYNPDKPLVTPLSTPITTHFDYDSYYLGTGSAGTIGDKLAYGVEVVYEGGMGLSNSFTSSFAGLSPVHQTRDPIRAWAADGRIDYLVGDLERTRISGELTFSSGDRDRLNTSNTFGGNHPRSVDRAFNGFGVINTGLAFGANVSNLVAARVGVSSFLFQRVPALREFQLGSDFFLFFKTERDAPAEEASSAGRVLGIEQDFFVNWQIRSDVILALRYGVFVPNGDVLSSGSTRQFFSAGVTFAF